MFAELTALLVTSRLDLLFQFGRLSSVIQVSKAQLFFWQLCFVVERYRLVRSPRPKVLVCFFVLLFGVFFALLAVG